MLEKEFSLTVIIDPSPLVLYFIDFERIKGKVNLSKIWTQDVKK